MTVPVPAECSGNSGMVAVGLDAVRKCGTYVHVAIYADGVVHNVDWNLVSARKELCVIGSSLGHGSWGRAFELLSVSLPFAPVA